jgi:hypothetical protein
MVCTTARRGPKTASGSSDSAFRRGATFGVVAVSCTYETAPAASAKVGAPGISPSGVLIARSTECVAAEPTSRTSSGSFAAPPGRMAAVFPALKRGSGCAASSRRSRSRVCFL